MRDFAQYTSRLPSPNFKRGTNIAGGQKQQQPERSPTKIASPNTNNNSSSSRGSSNRNISFAEEKNQLRQYDASSGGGAGAGDEPSVVVQQLRERLRETMASDTSAKAALTESDAMILDLQSNQRQLKRQLDLLQDERAQINKELQTAKANVTNAVTNAKTNTTEAMMQS